MEEDQIISLDRLVVVIGGDGDAGQCFDNTWPWAAGGALAGSLGGWPGAALGAVGGGGAAYLTLPSCGDGRTARQRSRARASRRR
jgi:hypothetical protein